jgi:thiol-disulfide isomerase/thioredoxin
MAGKSFKLSDYRGKYALLDFWATWCGPCIGEIPYLKQAHEKFKDRGDFAMISLSLDKTINEPREFLKKNDLPWVQGYLGDWSETKVAGQYGVEGIPAIFLVSPEGKLIESELEGSSIISRIEKRLK